VGAGPKRRGTALRAFAFGLLAVLLAFNHQSAPSKTVVTGARMTWYGTFTFAKETEVDEPNAATRKKNILTGILPPPVSSDRVAFVADTWFGYGYELIGRPPDALVTLRYVTKIPPPGLPDAVTGQMKLVSESQWPGLAIGRKDLFRATSLGNLEDTPAGIWTLQVWYEDRMLLEKNFTVARP
jgi:hypothetical protein